MKHQFALIGDPIIHSVSPFIHKRLFEISKIYAEYNLFNISTKDLGCSMSILKNLDGYNITLPHKQNIIPFLDNLCDKAKLYNCVNTVKNENMSCGYNTDADGFIEALKIEKIPLNGNVIILGCGGAARIFGFESVLNDCNVTFAVREQSISKANSLCIDIKKLTNKSVNITSIDNLPSNIDLLINATPVGMYPNHEEIPIQESYLSNCKCVFDAIYNPLDTLLIEKANANGSKVSGGLSMLVLQAVFAHKIWNNTEYTIDEIHQLIEDTKNELKTQFKY